MASGVDSVNRLKKPDKFLEFPRERLEQPIHQVFEEQVRRTPGNPALLWHDSLYSYEELNSWANRNARALQAACFSGKRPIALLLDQGAQVIVWTLASLKCGFLFAPLDFRLPDALLRPMLEQLDPGAVVTTAARAERVRSLCGDGVPVLSAEQDHSNRSDRNLGESVAVDSPAYVFFTSGSTGAAKGVVDSHRNVLNNIQRYTNTLGFSASDRMSLIQQPSFSGTVSTQFGALLNGALLMPFDLGQRGLSALSEWVKSERISIFHSVPAIFRGLRDPIDRFPDLRLVRLEGDRSMPIDLEHFRNNCAADCVLVNGLGTTETGLVRQFFVDQQSARVEADFVPVGYPVEGFRVILDSAGYEQSERERVGEILVESEYLAMGYWRNPELDAARFEQGPDGIRRYRTGDLGRMSADGCLVHMGRTDRKVKVAGNFVDLNILERELLQVTKAAQALVVDHIDLDGDRRLVAYLVPGEEGRPDTGQIRVQLSARLASHQLPAAYVFLDSLPLSKDQKVDRNQLPPPSRWRPQLAHPFVAATGDLEKEMERKWAEVLQLDSVGVTDSFFELGGDSLRAQRLLARLDSGRFGELEILDLFERPTIRSLLSNPAMAGNARPKVSDPAPEPLTASTEPLQSGTLENGGQIAGPEIDDRIAVIGMSLRVPGADSIERFWDNLRAGKESISFFAEPGEEVASETPAGQRFVAARGLISNVDQFDAELFRMTPRQARMLDPQQRIWLETVYLAAEDAGLQIFTERDGLAPNLVGVFAGARESSYLLSILAQSRELADAYLNQADPDMRQLGISNDRDSLATRTSFVFGFNGPSINVQTACSTSLVAIAQACQAIALKQCSVAIAGGVSVSFPQRRRYSAAENDIYSADGHCRSFDARADGTVFGDGVGVVVLKRLSEALADGDRIDAVVRGWAVNNDGGNKASFSAPSAEGQAEVITQALRHAKVSPERIGLIEAHGTATRIGDPIEFEGLRRAFRKQTGQQGFCALGSVKSNIGHLDVAAGVAGFIKAVLAIKHGEIPGTVHFEKVNPEIELSESPFFINAGLTAWPSSHGSRIAGVSSLGVGGTNCHVILEQSPRAEESVAGVALPSESHRGTDASATDTRNEILSLTAATEDSLNALADGYAKLLESGSELAEVTKAAHRTRVHLDWRMSAVAKSAAEMAAMLRKRNAAADESGRRPRKFWKARRESADASRIGFVFAGQGAQYAGMGHSLFVHEPLFRETLEHCDSLMSRYAPNRLLDLLYGASTEQKLLDRTEHAQPVLFALQIALTRLLQSWGLQPRSVMGHSLGAYAAACIAGVFSLEDGIRLTVERGRLMQSLKTSGAMLAVFEEAATLEALIAPYGDLISIAAINSKQQTVISGESDAIGRLRNELERNRIYCKDMRGSHAFHSSLMTPMLEPYQQFASGITMNPPSLPLISDLYGREVGNAVASAKYWRDHARQTVRFGEGLQSMYQAGCRLFVEIGPDLTLSGLEFMDDSIEAPAWFPTLIRGVDDEESVLGTVAGLYTRGARVDWRAIDNTRTSQGNPGTRRTSPARIPRYPFDRKRYWYDELQLATGVALPEQGDELRKKDEGHPLLGSRVRLPRTSEIRFEKIFNTQAPHFIEDHTLFGIPVVPGASHFAMLAQASAELGMGDQVCFEEIVLVQPLVIADLNGRYVQLIFRPDASGWQVELISAPVGSNPDPTWSTHLFCRARPIRNSEQTLSKVHNSPRELQARLPVITSGADFYSKIWANQGGTGSAFRWIRTVWSADQESLCVTKSPEGVIHLGAYRLHPGLIESACQVLHCCAQIERAEDLVSNHVTYVPFSVDELQVLDSMSNSTQWWCHARIRQHSEESVTGDLAIYSFEGTLIARINGFCLRRIDRNRLESEASLSPSSIAPATIAVPATSSPGRDHRSSPAELMLYIRQKCAELSGTGIEYIRHDRGFIDAGLDSMMAVILANHLRRDWRLKVKVSEVLNSSRLDSLATALFERINPID